MYLSSSDGTDNMNVDGISQIRQENTSSHTSNSQTSPPSPSSPSSSFPALLVVDDNSNSDDSSFNQSHIPAKTLLPTPETTHAQGTPVATTPPTNDNSNDTPDQQRRRNSSIAKLLGGQPLNNQQYEDIHQRIIDDQTTQTMNTNGDNSTDSPIPRSRSSITRTLLMNAERNMNGTHVPAVSTRSISPSFPQDFEYLIRRELDIEHAPSTLYRNSSTPSVFQNLSSARSTPPASSPTPSQSKLKRKRANPKQVLLPGAACGKASSAAAPFAMRDPFELGSSSSIPSVSSTTLSHPQQNDLYRFDGLYHRPRPQAQFLSALNNGPSDSPPPPPPPFNYHRPTQVPSNYGQMKSHFDRVPPASSRSSVNTYPYPAPIDLALPHTSSHSHLSSSSQHTSGVSPRKSKSSNARPDPHESPIQRLQSIGSNPSSVSSSSSSSSSSSGQSIPLKKRLLHAYKNERWPSSSL